MSAELLSSQDLEAERRHICPDFLVSSPMVTHPEGNPRILPQIKTYMGKHHNQSYFKMSPNLPLTNTDGRQVNRHSRYQVTLRQTAC